MNDVTVVLFGVTTLSILGILLCLAFLNMLRGDKSKFLQPKLRRFKSNPILSPIKEHVWESEAVFNPTAYYDGENVHLLYRALGSDGISRIGYARSADGINFKRLPYPVFTADSLQPLKHSPYTSPARLQYNRELWASGGGWGGSEDPRMVAVNGRVYVTFNVFNGWYSMRVGLISISEEDLKNNNWNWSFNFLSPPNGRHKNWVLFPEKIHDKFALFHNLFHTDPSRVLIEYLDEVELPTYLPPFHSPDPQQSPDRQTAWHYRTRSAGPPPIKTKYGWLLLYHAMDKIQSNIGYKLGAMLLDLNDPTRVICRSSAPVLEPTEWYENDWKPGVIYASGAVVLGDDLVVYYGGGDKHVAAAKINLRDFINRLTDNGKILKKHKSLKL
jgi:predicted GH43/DUF377 family glycosyl hydrolase